MFLFQSFEKPSSKPQLPARRRKSCGKWVCFLLSPHCALMNTHTHMCTHARARTLHCCSILVLPHGLLSASLLSWLAVGPEVPYIWPDSPLSFELLAPHHPKMDFKVISQRVFPKPPMPRGCLPALWMSIMTHALTKTGPSHIPLLIHLPPLSVHHRLPPVPRTGLLDLESLKKLWSE